MRPIAALMRPVMAGLLMMPLHIAAQPPSTRADQDRWGTPSEQPAPLREQPAPLREEPKPPAAVPAPPSPPPPPEAPAPAPEPSVSRPAPEPMRPPRASQPAQSTPQPQPEETAPPMRSTSPPSSILQRPRNRVPQTVIIEQPPPPPVVIERPVPVIPDFPYQPSGVVVTPPPEHIGPPPEVIAAPGRAVDTVLIDSFPGGGRVREGGFSPVFPTDTWRAVESIEIFWSDRGQHARGRLYVDGERISRWGSREVDSPGRALFVVDDVISQFVIQALHDDLWLSRIVIRYVPGSGLAPWDEYNFTDRPLRIPEDESTALFPIDPNRLVTQIQVAWGDGNLQRARGRLYLEGSGRRFLERRTVQAEGEVVSWDVFDHAQGFRIQASRGDLFLFWIRVHYESGGVEGPRPGPVCIHGPDMGNPVYVPEGTLSRPFYPPFPNQVVQSIRVVWEDREGEAQGHLMLNDEASSRFRSQEVRTTGEVRWIVGTPVSSIRFFAENDPLWIRELWVEY